VSRRKTNTTRLPYATALAVAAGVVAVRSVLLIADGLDRLQELSLSDPLWPALAVLLVLLLGPYVQEVEAVGARVVRREVPGARDTAGEVAELAAGEQPDDAGPPAVRGPASEAVLGEDAEAELAVGRFLGVQLALAGAAARFPELDGARLHLYVPDDADRLLPVLEHDDPDLVWSRGWDAGTGVVGRAWSRRRVQVGRGAALLDEVRALPDKPVEAFGPLQVVVAVPLLNLAGRPVGVLSATSDDLASRLDGPVARRELEALAAGLTRVLVDLAGWATDDPHDDA
jgi:hypothetical protein